MLGLLIGCGLSSPAAGLAATQFATAAGSSDLQSQSPQELTGSTQPVEPVVPEGSTAPTGPGTPSGPAGPPAPADPGDLEDPTEPSSGWLEDKRLVVEEQLGEMVEGFDLFFDKTRRLDLEAPSSRFRFKTFVRTTEVENFAMGFAVGTSISLPRLNHLFRNARLLLVGEKVTARQPLTSVGAVPPGGAEVPISSAESDAAVAELTRGRGRAEVRFDVVRAGVLVFDTGAGVTFAWPPVPFANIRAHLRLKLGAGFLLRATDVLFVEMGGRGPGTSLDLEVERYFGETIRLRWEGHGLFAEQTRGIEWSTLVGGEWKAHARTGFFTSLGCNGVGTPSPGLDVWRAWLGFRQDVWRGWIFAGLEPEVTWPRPAGMTRTAVWALTARLEVVVEGRGAAEREHP